jgi:hypothetical protein
MPLSVRKRVFLPPNNGMHIIVRIQRRLQAFFWLQVYTAIRLLPIIVSQPITHTVGRRPVNQGV